MFRTPKVLLRSYSTQSKPVVAILGGGITGLSAAYYLSNKYGDSINPIVLERSNRVGGWVKTVHMPKGSRYEIGPRTIRPAGLSGMNTLDLVEELGLDRQVLYVEKNHPTAKNRFVYVNGKLCKLPSDGKVLYRKQEPFSKPLFWSVLRDLVAKRKKSTDDSIHNFMSRRFGPEVADYLVDPLIRGICAGDARDISVKFLMKQPFEYEQQYGSVLAGFLASKLKSKQSARCSLSEDHRSIGFSKIAASSPNWAVWTLENGLESLVEALEKRLFTNRVQIMKQTEISKINFDGRKIKIEFTHKDNRPDQLHCDHLISACSADSLSNLLQNSNATVPEDMTKALDSVASVDLQVTCLTYDNPELILQNGFGFLVPSVEKSVEGLLGVVFDTNSFPQERERTVLTVMSKDRHAQDLDKIKWYLHKTLGIKEHPSEHHIEVLRNCIPQYSVGHYEKIEWVKRQVASLNLPLSVAGATWGGVSVNDCILNGRTVAVEVGDKLKR